MAYTSLVFIIVTIALSLLQIHDSLSMVITPTIANAIVRNPTATRSSMHLLRVRTRNSLIETSVNDKQLYSIENQLQQKRIPYRRIPVDGDGIIIIVGPFHKATTHGTKELILKSDSNNITNERVPAEENRLDDDYSRTPDRESFEFRHCLEACEVFEDEELKPDHDCIRKKCLDDITGI